MPTRHPAVHAVLALLARGERHGYELRRALEEELGPGWRIDFGQLYRLLASMERDGWVRVRVERGHGGPDRKVYILARRGRAEIERWLREPGAAVQHGRDELPLKLGLALGREAPAAREMIATRRRGLQSEQMACRASLDKARGTRDVGRWLLAETRLRQVEGALAALDSWEACAPGPKAQPSVTAAPMAADDEGTLSILGSDDPLLDLLAHRVAEGHARIRLSSSPVGSLAGLLALQEGKAHLAGIHLLDVDSGEYNVPFVKNLMPENPVVLVNLAYREQGLMLAPGNPKGIRRLDDLARGDVRLVNRQKGAGTRLLLFHRLRGLGIDPGAIPGYAREVPTHNAVAAAIATGTADAGPGIRAVAEAWGLEFIPMGRERYDLAIPRPVFESPRLRPVLETLHEAAFKQEGARLAGYDLERTGEIVADIH